MNSGVALHFCSANRAFAVGQHRAYVAGVMEKLVPAFENIEAEADQYANEVYERFGEMPGWEDGPDLADLADIAGDEGIGRYQDLVFVKGELIGFATGGMYHLWEKTLKSFLLRELGHYGLTDAGRKEIEQANYEKLSSWLKDMGFDFSIHPYADLLDICRLVANTVKHGDGASCQKLAEKAPELLRGPYGIELPFGKTRAEELWIEPTKFKEFAEAIEAFWQELPERLCVAQELYREERAEHV